MILKRGIIFQNHRKIRGKNWKIVIVLHRLAFWRFFFFICVLSPTKGSQNFESKTGNSSGISKDPTLAVFVFRMVFMVCKTIPKNQERAGNLSLYFIGTDAGIFYILRGYHGLQNHPKKRRENGNLSLHFTGVDAGTFCILRGFHELQKHPKKRRDNEKFVTAFQRGRCWHFLYFTWVS